MLKSTSPTLHKTTRTEITPRFSSGKLLLDETPKAISPFGPAQDGCGPGVAAADHRADATGRLAHTAESVAVNFANAD
jgi:hypothetical protein